MRVRVAITVDVDPEAWAVAYGLPVLDSPAIRDHVRDHVNLVVRDWLWRNRLESGMPDVPGFPTYGPST